MTWRTYRSGNTKFDTQTGERLPDDRAELRCDDAKKLCGWPWLVRELP